MLTRIAAAVLSGLFLVPSLAAAEAAAPDSSAKPVEAASHAILERMAARQVEVNSAALLPAPSSGYVPPTYQTNRLFVARPARLATPQTYQLHRESPLEAANEPMHRSTLSRLFAELSNRADLPLLQTRFEAKVVPYTCSLTVSENGCTPFLGRSRSTSETPSTIRKPDQPIAPTANDRDLLLGIRLPPTT